MIAPSRARAYRRFYLYSALTLALTATAAAVALLIRALLQTLDPALYPAVTGRDISQGVSLAIAILVVALPVGAAHLILIRRLLREPDEGATDIRHQCLALWIAGALLAELITAMAVINALTNQPRPDTTLGLAIVPVAAAIAIVAVWWAARTPPARAIWRVRAAILVLIFSMVVVGFSVASAASAAGGLVSTNERSPVQLRGFDLYAYQERSLRSGASIALAGLAVWAAALGWLWHRRAERDRLIYEVVMYGVGVALLFVALAYELSGAVRFAASRADLVALTVPWPAGAAAVVLTLLHGGLLVVDRGRNGLPPIVVTRLLLAVPATAGLAALLAGVGAAWHGLVDQLTTAGGTNLGDTSLALGFVLVGVIYPLAAVPFFRRSPSASAIRRFYLYDVVCLGLFATVATAVTTAYYAIVAFTAATGDSGRAALDWSVPTLVLGAVFAVHLRVLLRDHRATAFASPAEVSDPLTALLEEVRGGRLGVEPAAAMLRERGAPPARVPPRDAETEL